MAALTSAEYEKLSGPQITLFNNVNLAAVTSATPGTTIELGLFKHKTFFVEVTVNTGAVTVNIESSHDGTNWFNEVSQTSTATVEDFKFDFTNGIKFWRATTTTQSDSTVTVTAVGRS